MTTLTEIRIENLKAFENNPFIFREDTAFEMLIDSISNLGVLTPIIVRSLDDGNYEIISGHRRAEACRRLGIETIPCIVKELTRDEATVILVDLNLQRDEVLPSEKAHAYKMKMDALKNQGARTDLTYRQPVDKLNDKRAGEVIGEAAGESERQVQRYIRLTYLIPEILKLVDEGRISLTPAVELSYLAGYEQEEVYSFYEHEEVTPSYSQAVRLKKLSQEFKLTDERLFEIMSEAKANQKAYLKIPTESLERYFKSRFTEKQKQEFVIKAVEHYHRYLMRQRDAR